MSLDTAKKCVDWIFNNVPSDFDAVDIDFIGGEPLLEFGLMKSVYEYVCDKKPEMSYVLYATTNGTLLTPEMKTWFTTHKDTFYLGLSLDGKKETHDHNRNNSFDSIDIDFFRKYWPEQSVKMTLSEYSLRHFAADVQFIHSLGFEVEGANLFEGSFNWDKDEYIKLLVPQLQELVDFYVRNEQLPLNQMLDKPLNICESKNKTKTKWCGIGIGTVFFDVDGKQYPCSYVTPMSFPQHELDDILATDFTDDENFIDDDCFNDCYIYPICTTCAGGNYMVNKTFKIRNKSKCRIQKLIALFIADLQAKLIQKNPSRYDDTTLFYTIEAIKQIRERYLGEFKPILLE
jgi:sulfatase maturation enzyme AslB (radical SAM superfamily)